MSDGGAYKSVLGSMVDKIVGGQKTSSSLPITLVLLCVVIVIFSIIGVTLVLSRRKAVKLAARLRKLEEEKAQAEENFRLETNGTLRHESSAKVNELDLRIRDVRGEIEGLDERNRHTLEGIAKITDWEDFVTIDKRNRP